MSNIHRYEVTVEPKDAPVTHYQFDAYTAADALTQAKVFFDWQLNHGYTIHRMETCRDREPQEGRKP